jgi:hypothetical protein
VLAAMPTSDTQKPPEAATAAISPVKAKFSIKIIHRLAKTISFVCAPRLVKFEEQPFCAAIGAGLYK